MAETQKTAYRLYAMSLSRKNVEYATSQQFSRVTTDYILIYTEKAKPKGALDISGEDIEKLCDEDRRWLCGCNIIILAKQIDWEDPSLIRNLSESMEELEQELRDKKEELDGKGLA